MKKIDREVLPHPKSRKSVFSVRDSLSSKMSKKKYGLILNFYFLGIYHIEISVWCCRAKISVLWSLNLNYNNYSASFSQKKTDFFDLWNDRTSRSIFCIFFAYLIWVHCTDLSENGFFGILAILKNFTQKIYIPSMIIL